MQNETRQCIHSLENRLFWSHVFASALLNNPDSWDSNYQLVIRYFRRLLDDISRILTCTPHHPLCLPLQYCRQLKGIENSSKRATIGEMDPFKKRLPHYYRFDRPLRGPWSYSLYSPFREATQIAQKNHFGWLRESVEARAPVFWSEGRLPTSAFESCASHKVPSRCWMEVTNSDGKDGLEPLVNHQDSPKRLRHSISVGPLLFYFHRVIGLPYTEEHIYYYPVKIIINRHTPIFYICPMLGTSSIL